MAKKKPATKPAPKPAKAASKPSSDKKPRVVKLKGGFGVFQVILKENVKFEDDVVDLWPAGPILLQVAGGTDDDSLADTAAAEKWIRDNATAYNGKDLIIAQVKKTVKVAVQTVQKVVLS